MFFLILLVYLLFPRCSLLAYPTPIVLSIDDTPSIQNFTTFGGFPLGTAGFTLSQYDYFTFALSPRPPGTVLDIEIKTIGGAPNTNNYLWFTGFVNPFSMLPITSVVILRFLVRVLLSYFHSYFVL
jgi:hypothetical protein